MPVDEHQAAARKRSRATAEQLAVLEEVFAVNVSPNSKLRKELADKLKMTDRSIQIWFQNRRAKVKHMQKKAQLQLHQAALRAQLHHYQQQHFYLQQKFGTSGPHQRTQSADAVSHHARHVGLQPWPSATTSRLATGSTTPATSSNLVHPTIAPVPPHHSPPPSTDDQTPLMTSWLTAGTVIPQEDMTCTMMSTIDPTQLSSAPQETQSLGVSALTIGQWHRIKMREPDLRCVFQTDPAPRLCWFIVDGLHHFKMEMPVAQIDSLVLTVTGAEGALKLTLTSPPQFYMRQESDAWLPCSDFTEHRQASQELVHTLRGDALILWQDMTNLLTTHPGTQTWAHLVDPSLCTNAIAASIDPALDVAFTPLPISPPGVITIDTASFAPSISTSSCMPMPCNLSSSASSTSSSSASSLSLSPPSLHATLPVAAPMDARAYEMAPSCAATTTQLPNNNTSLTASTVDDFLVEAALMDPGMWSSCLS